MLRAEAPLGGSATRLGMRPATAFVVALAHLALIGAAAIVLPRRIQTPAKVPVLAVVFQPPAPPALPQMLASSALPAATVSVAAALSPIPERQLRADTHALLQRTARRYSVSRPVQAVPQAAGVRQEAAPPAPPAPLQQVPRASSARALEAWEALVHRAVQDAVVYPNAARLMHREGRTRVRFDYGHGAVSGVSVAESSGFAVLDQAALGAVTRAAIPPPPPELGGQTRPLIVWVDFTLAGDR